MRTITSTSCRTRSGQAGGDCSLSRSHPLRLDCVLRAHPVTLEAPEPLDPLPVDRPPVRDEQRVDPPAPRFEAPSGRFYGWQAFRVTAPLSGADVEAPIPRRGSRGRGR
jgi:hypothetical protein